MKTRILSILMSSALCAAAFAQENVTEETVVNKPDKVTIVHDRNSVSIAIDGREGNHDYRYFNRFALGENGNEMLTETDDRREWNFSLPFEKKLPATYNGDRYNTYRNRKWYHNPNFAGFGVGLATAVKAPEEMEVDMTSSCEFTWVIAALEDGYWPNKHWTHSIGFGLNWRNYSMTGRQRFVQQGDQLVVADYPDGTSPDFSCIQIFSLMVPLTVACSFNKTTDFQFGPIVCFNTYARVKTCYNDADGRQKDRFKGIHQRPLTIDFQAKLSYKAVGLYVRYSPFTVLRTDFAPKFQGLSAGIILGY